MKEIEDIDHIPITEEWLRRFGFKDGLISDFKSLPIGNNTYLSGSENGVWVDKVVDGKDYSVGLGGAIFVHQLQNLYFALTGKELILKTAE